jgi:hypothetical protein
VSKRGFASVAIAIFLQALFLPKESGAIICESSVAAHHEIDCFFTTPEERFGDNTIVVISSLAFRRISAQRFYAARLRCTPRGEWFRPSRTGHRG